MQDFDSRLGHRLGHDDCEGGLEHRMRNGGRRDRSLAADILAGMAAAVAELNRGHGAAGVNLADQAIEARQEAVVIDAELAPTMSAGLFGRRHLDRDEAGAAPRARHVIGDGVVGDEAGFVRQARRHRRHDDAILDRDRADPGRREQNIQRLTAEPVRVRPVSASPPWRTGLANAARPRGSYCQRTWRSTDN